MKKALLIVAVVLAAVILAVLLLPPFINLGAYKARYLPLVEEALQRKVDVGEVRLWIIPGPSIRISDLKVFDHPAFSKEPFFAARQLKLQLHFWPLLKGQLQVAELVLEKPSVNLIKRPDGTFNFSDIGKEKGGAKKAARPQGKEPVRLSELIPARLRIADGDLSFRTIGQKPLRIQGIDLSLQDFSTRHPFPYRVALRLAGLKPISLEGPLRYDESKAALSLKENHLKVQGVDFVINGSVSELTGVPRLNLTLANGRFETRPIFELLSTLRVMPKETEVSGPLGLKLSVTGPSHKLTSQVRAEFKGLKVNDRRAFKGTIVGQSDLSLPLGGEAPARQLEGSGKIAITDGALTNVDLIAQIQLLTGLAGVPQEQARGATTFKTLETDFTLAGGVARIKRLHLESPLMEVSGSGKLTLAAPTVDLGLEAALAPQISARAKGGKGAAFLKDSQGRIVVPLKITGPVKGPTVTLDSAKLLRKGTDQLLDQLFKKRR